MSTSTQNADSHLIRVGGVEISVRILFTLIMVGLLASLVLPTVIQWVRQEHIRNETIAQLEEARARQSDVQRQLDLWADPEYIASQARERLGYVKPGETQYSVVDPGPEYQDTAQVAASAPRGPARPWMYNFVVLTALADSTADVPAQRGALRTPEQSTADQPASDAAQSAQGTAQPQSADDTTAQESTDQENPEGESE